MTSLFAALLSSLALAAPTDIKLALNWKPEPQFGGFYAASLNKLDIKNDLKLNIQEGGSGTPTVQMLAAKQVDAAIVSAEEIIINNIRNPKNPVVGIFAVYQINPQMIMCRQEAGHTSLQDVFEKGTTLALQSGLSYAQFLKQKYSRARVKMVPYLGGLTNYLQDPKFCQQGFITSEPLSAEKAGKPAKTFMVSDEGFNPYTTVVAVRLETLEKKPELVKKLAATVKAGWENYLTSPDKTNAEMARLNKAMDAETFEKSAILQAPLIQTTDTRRNGLGSMTTERWSELVKQLHDLKLIDKTVPASTLFRNF